jgi:hypothetical protein
MQDVHVVSRSPKPPPTPLFHHRRSRRASDAGASESPTRKNSTEGGGEAFSTGGEKVDDDDEGEQHSSPSPSALQRYALSDGVLLFVEEAKNDGDLTVRKEKKTKDARERGV